MGLSVVHGIVKKIGGGIKVNSTPGKGTKFQIYLPITKDPSERRGPIAVEPIKGGTERILFVDDEGAIIEMGELMLERMGYQVVTRTSSVKALEAFKANPAKFDLVITDMSMPNMTGDKLAFELIKIRPDIPVVLCTGFSEMISEEKAASLGIRGFLMKPIVMRDLSNKIREVLGKQQE